MHRLCFAALVLLCQYGCAGTVTKREVGQAQRVHVLGDRELQDGEAERGRLSEIPFGTSSFCKGRRRPDELPALLSARIAEKSK